MSDIGKLIRTSVAVSTVSYCWKTYALSVPFTPPLAPPATPHAHLKHHLQDLAVRWLLPYRCRQFARFLLNVLNGDLDRGHDPL